MAEQDGILFDRVERTACPGCHAEIDVAALEPFSRAACPECGAELTVPARLANYQLLACLGSGGMGSVYRAYDETLAREVAIKVMKKSLGSQPEFLESFRREAQAAAKLNHPNIAQIYSFGEEKGQPYIVMEYVPGKHLEDMIEGPDTLDQKMVMKIGMDIADGLQLATASNLIHGDIKPGNILMNDRDSAKLVDFGIASSPDAEQTEIWGTPYYIAPEKVKREKIDFRSDMYCLGGTLYHAITKKPPFDGEDAMAVVKARLAAPARPLRELRPDVDPDVERIIMRTLELDPAKRYASYGDLMADISAYLSRGKTQPVTPAGGASKKIIIKSRASRNRAPDAPAADGGAPAAETPAAPRTLHVPGDGPGGTLTGGGDGEGEEPKKSSALKWIAIVLVLLLCAGGGTAGYLLHAKSVREKQEAADRAALIASQGAALAPLEATRKAANALAEKVAGQASEASAIVAEAVAAVERAEGDGWAERITKESPAALKGLAKLGDMGALGEAPAEEESPAAEGEAAPEAAAEEAAAAAGEAPAAEETPAETDVAEAAAAPEAPAAEDAPEGESLEGLPLAAREIFLLLAPIRQAAALTPLALGAFEKQMGRAADIASANHGDIDLPALKAAVEKNREAIGLIAQKAAEQLAALEMAANGFDALIREARGALDALKAASAAAVADAERRATEEKAAEEARAEKARQEADEAAKRAAEEAEVARVRAVVPANLENISNWKLGPVLRELDKTGEALTFKSAQKALKVERRRVEGLQSLKDFLVARLSSDDKFIHQRDRWRVVSADVRSVEIKPARPKDAKPQRRKWEELQPEQIVPMLIYYLGDKEKAKAFPLRERVNAYIDMAVYFVIVRGDDSHALEAAKSYCERAIADAPSRQREIVETLYELDFAEE